MGWNGAPLAGKSRAMLCMVPGTYLARRADSGLEVTDDGVTIGYQQAAEMTRLEVADYRALGQSIVFSDKVPCPETRKSRVLRQENTCSETSSHVSPDKNTRVLRQVGRRFLSVFGTLGVRNY